MKAKDALLSPEQFRSIEEQAHKSSWEEGNELFPEELIAEISFKAGIKEVVEWIKERDCGDKSCVVIAIDDWQAKLKEWRIE